MRNDNPFRARNTNTRQAGFVSLFEAILLLSGCIIITLVSATEWKLRTEFAEARRVSEQRWEALSSRAESAGEKDLIRDLEKKCQPRRVSFNTKEDYADKEARCVSETTRELLSWTRLAKDEPEAIEKMIDNIAQEFPIRP